MKNFILVIASFLTTAVISQECIVNFPGSGNSSDVYNYSTAAGCSADPELTGGLSILSLRKNDVFHFDSPDTIIIDGDWTNSFSSNGATIEIDPGVVVMVKGDLIFSGSGSAKALNINGELLVEKSIRTNNNLAWGGSGSLTIGDTLFASNGGNFGCSGLICSNIFYSHCTGNNNFCNNVGNVTLPIKLIEFKGSLVQNEAVLDWSTAEEVNNNYFEILHSVDGISFEKIAEINGSGFSNERIDYSYTTSEIIPGTNYFAIRQVDFDGQAEQFPMIALEYSVENGIYPNPFSEAIHIDLGISNELTSVKIFDESNRLVIEQSTYRNLTLNTSNLESGMYIIEITTGSQLSRQALYKN